MWDICIRMMNIGQIIKSRKELTLQYFAGFSPSKNWRIITTNYRPLLGKGYPLFWGFRKDVCVTQATELDRIMYRKEEWMCYVDHGGRISTSVWTIPR